MPDKNIDQKLTSLEEHVDRLMDKKLPDPEPIVESTLVNGDPKLTKDSPIDVADDPLVDAIVAHESDEILAAQDAEVAVSVDTPKQSWKQRIKNFLQAWWHNKWARYGTLAGVALLFILVGAIPTSRYLVLNSIGVRAASSVTIIDRDTQLPLKNVLVETDGIHANTNQQGVATLDNLKLGSHQITIKRLGFATEQRTVTLGLGSNPLGEISLKAIGLQYKFKLVDFLTGKAVKKAEVMTSDNINALSDDKGVATLTVGEVADTQLNVTVSAAGYRSEKLTIDSAMTAVTNVTLTAKRKAVFISKQSGKYDVFKMDIDGKNKQLLLAGTGLENDQVALVQHPTNEEAALVSTRDNKRNQDGYLLQSLTLIDVEDGSTLSLDSSERIQVIDWVEDKLIYVKIKAGTSAGNPERYQLMSYDYDTTARIQLATANYFSDVVSVKGMIYYVSSNNYKGGEDQFVTISPDNSGKQVLLSSEIWNIVRMGYDDLKLSGPQGWYSYRLGDTAPKKLAGTPADVNDTRFYLDAADGKNALWTESRDGKGVLLAYDAVTKKDITLATQSGLGYPLRWLNSRTVIYRVVTPQETADYVVSLDGANPRKITDVTNAAGFGRWYYY